MTGPYYDYYERDTEHEELRERMDNRERFEPVTEEELEDHESND